MSEWKGMGIMSKESFSAERSGRKKRSMWEYLPGHRRRSGDCGSCLRRFGRYRLYYRSLVARRSIWSIGSKRWRQSTVSLSARKDLTLL
ncbi:hypothetical protein IMSAG185_01200 [Lachnospiraceae bacterium]|nr:hypothetical protein IMSAG185_01200 [Lachnospiraceae bacterium]